MYYNIFCITLLASNMKLVLQTHRFCPFPIPSIQDLDGSFFEKFGSILRQKSIQNDESVRARLEPFPDENEAEAESGADPTTLPPVAEAEDSGTETLLDESDSEDQQEKQAEFIEDVFGWNVSIDIHICKKARYSSKRESV